MGIHTQSPAVLSRCARRDGFKLNSARPSSAHFDCHSKLTENLHPAAPSGSALGDSISSRFRPARASTGATLGVSRFSHLAVSFLDPPFAPAPLHPD